MKNKGFTLVELLITIAIIGILASLVLPRLFGPTEQGRSAEARNMLGAIRQAQEAFRTGPQGQYLPTADTDGDGRCTDGENADASGITAWQRLGVGDPNANANSFFGYCIVTPSATQFVIRASRIGTDSNGDGTDDVMCLNQDGIWSGDYTQRPFNQTEPPSCSGNPDCC